MKAVNIRRSWIALSWLAVLMSLPLGAMATTYTWDGANNYEWFSTPTHWTPSAWVNGSGNDAIIAADHSRVYNASSVTANSVTIGPGNLNPHVAQACANGFQNVTLVIINAGGALYSSGNNYSHLNAINLNGGRVLLSSSTVNNGYGNFNFRGTVTVNGGATQSLIDGYAGTLGQTGGTIFNVADGAAPVDLLVSAQFAFIAGQPDTGLIKQGAGLMSLTGTNTYTAATKIGGGTLLANNGTSSTGTGAVTVDAAGTLGGTGKITPTGANNIVINGVLSPGDGGAGTLNIALGTGKLAFGSGASLNMDLGTASDLVSFSSAGDWLSGSGNATLNLSLGAGFDYGNTYTLIHNVTTTGFTFADITGHNAVAYTASVSKSGNDYTLAFTPNLPTIVLSGTHAVDENLPAGTTVGSFNMLNPPGSPPITYSFVAGANDNGSFQLSGANNSELQTAAIFDRETKSSYVIDVRGTAAAPGNETTDGQFTITVNNVVEPMRFYALGTVPVGDTLVGTLQSAPGDNTSVTYSIATDEAGVFAPIGGNELRLVAAPVAGDLGKAYYVQVRATGDQTSETQTMWIKVTVANTLTSGTIFIFR